MVEGSDQPTWIDESGQASDQNRTLLSQWVLDNVPNKALYAPGLANAASQPSQQNPVTPSGGHADTETQDTEPQDVIMSETHTSSSITDSLKVLQLSDILMPQNELRDTMMSNRPASLNLDEGLRESEGSEQVNASTLATRQSTRLATAREQSRSDVSAKLDPAPTSKRKQTSAQSSRHKQANIVASEEEDTDSDFEEGQDVASSPQQKRRRIAHEPDENEFEIERIVARVEPEVKYKSKSRSHHY